MPMSRDPMVLSLCLDSDGSLWLREHDGDDARVTLLGPVSDPATSYRIPGELLGELGRLEAEWADAVEFGAAIRAEAIDTYRRNAL
jgi:hypothetical protein